MSKPKVCILSVSKDIHVECVLPHFEKYADVVFVGIDAKESAAKISYSKSAGFGIYFESDLVKISQFTSIWYRKPEFMIYNIAGMSADESLVHKYRSSELLGFLRDACTTAYSSNVFVLNPPKSMHDAKFKLSSRIVSEKLGFSTPNSIVSFKKTEIKDFLKLYEFGVIKVLNNPNVQFGKIATNFSTYRVDSKSFDTDIFPDNLDHPVWLQEYIEKAYELRVTVIGKKIYSCRIDSQAVEASKIDVRKGDPKIVPHSIYDLPENIERQCFELCRYYNLQYAAIDIAVTPEGKYIFFEINPNGQYLWIEEQTGLPLSQSIADLLVNPNMNKLI